MARRSRREVRQLAEQTVKAMEDLAIDQWATWVVDLLRALDSKAETEGFNPVTMLLAPVERNLRERLQNERW